MQKVYNNHAFLILSDCVSDALKRLYLQVRAATYPFGEVFILYHQKVNEPENGLHGYNTYTFTDSVMSELGYTPVRNTLVPGSNHFPVLKFYIDHPHFEYYWCIEDDVVFNGEWSSFFNQVIKNIEYDFISSFIQHYKHKVNPNWLWWHSLYKSGQKMDLNNLLMSFNPIYSLSNAAARFLDQSLKDGWMGHHEVLIATLLFLNKFKIKDFGGNGSFVPEGFHDKFYTNDTYLWRPAFRSPGRLLNKIYHPVKSQYKITTDFKYRISFCITGTEILEGLKQTLIKNIEDNLDYENYEFVILDYFESTTGAWIEDYIRDYVNNGKVVYYSSYVKKPYTPTHSKNIVSKLASGDILCYIHPKQFTGRDFATLVNDQFKLNSDIVIVTQPPKVDDQSFAYLENLCVKKTDFLHITGLDEKIKDNVSGIIDFTTRLEQTGAKKVTVNDIMKVRPNLGYRYNENPYIALDRILVQHLDSSASKVIFMYSTGAFEMGTLYNNASRKYAEPRYSFSKRKFRHKYALKGLGWTHGRWWLSGNNENLVFETATGKKFELVVQDEFYKKVVRDGHVKFYILNNPLERKSLINFHYQFKYSRHNKGPLSQKRVDANPSGFGNAIVCKNFDLYFPINTADENRI